MVKTDTRMDESSASPSVSIIIPCRNERRYIETCIESILKQEPPKGGFELIVVDGMSEDGTREILTRMAETYSCLRVVDNPDRMTSQAINQAIRAARGAVIIRMDAHTEYAPDYVRQCVAILEKTGADNVGGPARTKHKGTVQAAVCAAYHSVFSVGGARFHNVDYEGYVDTLPYGCWRREIFDQIGLFDEELVRNQDDEFNLRLTRAGGKIWQSPSIKSWYRPRASLKALFMQYRQYGYWKVRILQKYKIPASVRHLVPGTFVFLLLALLIASLVWLPALWLFLALVSCYAAANISVTLIVAAKNGWKLLPLLPIVFVCFHFGYGFGFARGVWDFILLRRKPGSSFSRLTRTATS
jgi:glycosyltransferase involved in cell wall biosynthesis